MTLHMNSIRKSTAVKDETLTHLSTSVLILDRTEYYVCGLQASDLDQDLKTSNSALNSIL